MSSCARRITRAAVLVALAGPGLAAPVRLPVTADASISAHATEQALNAGRAARIKLKGTENLILLAFDPALVRGKVVRRAALRLTGTGPGMTVRWVGLSSVATDWQEGPGGYTREEAGATFLGPGTAKTARWGADGSTFVDAVFGRGGTFWTRTTAARSVKDAYEIPVDGRLVEAVAAGLSTGIVLSDDSGQTMNIAPEIAPELNRSNNYFFSREQSAAGPVLTVELEEAPPAPGPGEVVVAVVPSAHGATGTGGGVEVSWDAPAGADLLGVVVRLGIGTRTPVAVPRWMLPGLAGRRRLVMSNLVAGEAVTAEVDLIGRAGRLVARGRGTGFASARIDLPVPFPRHQGEEASMRRMNTDTPSSTAPVRIYPDLVRIHPVTGVTLEPSAPVPVKEGVRLSALRGEWVAFQVVCDRATEGPKDWSVGISALTGPGGARIPASRFRLFRVAYVRTGAGPDAVWGDPLVPLGPGGAFTIPAAFGGVPDQSNQAIYAEVFVPANAKPGRYTGALAVTAGGRALPAVPVRLEVSKARLPAEAHFTWSFNAYDTPGGADERALYALAHDHRGTLAILHYSHSGNYTEGCVPPVAGTGGTAKVSDWSGFDARFGPLFDGSAFADTSRPGVPLDHFYLALSEHYPVPMAEGYRWNALSWEDHWRVAGTVQQGFSTAMQETWMAVARDYAAHIKAKGWRTAYQVYLNDKYFYKQVDPKTKRAGGGVSFWLLDEPMHADDFLALQFFGDLLRRALGGARAPLVFRADVSRPEWGRDLLDEVLDVNVSGAWPAQANLLEGLQTGAGQAVWTYGDTPAANTSALAIPAQALDLYAHGIDGYVPWLVLGGPEHWTTHATTAVILPGAPAGVAGPVATLRLKAYRRAEQDVEYLRLYADKMKWVADDPRRLRLRALLRDILPARIRAGSLDDQGAAVFSYGAVTPASLESIRGLIRAAL